MNSLEIPTLRISKIFLGVHQENSHEGILLRFVYLEIFENYQEKLSLRI